MGRIKSLKWQIIFGNTFIYGLLMIGMGLFIYFANFSILQKDIQVRNAQLFDTLEYKVEQYFVTPVAMIDQMRSHIDKNAAINQAILNTYLGTLINVYPFIEQIRVINAAGEIESIKPHFDTVIGSSVIYEEYYINRPKDNQVKWSEVYISQQTFKPTVTVTARAGNWLIAGDLDLSKMSDNLLTNRFDSVVSLSILDQYGTYLVDDNIKNVEERRRFPDFDNLKIAAQKGERFIPSKINKNMLQTAVNVGSDKQWYLVIVEDRMLLYKPLDDLMKYLLVTLLVVSVGSCIFMYFSTTQITKDLKLLESGTYFISSGDYSQKLLGCQFKEFHTFSERFNVMIESIETREEEINALNESLEESVLLRTQELIETNILLEETNAQLEEEVVEKQSLTDALIDANMTLEERVYERTQQLEEASQYKSEFLANMSHEIRTPMNGIMGMINVIELTQLTEEQTQYVRTVKSSADSLLTILNDILDFSKIEAGKIVIKDEPFNLKNTLEDLNNLFLASAQHKHLNLEVTMSENIPSQYMGDDNRIRQVLSNLIGNAIKFTHEGFVKVHVTGTDLGNNEIKLVAVVEDTGIGISEVHQEQLFERFTQFNNHNRSGNKGTGLGLAISKMLTDLMHGSLTVNSQLGKGSLFVMGLTLKVAEVTKEETTGEMLQKSNEAQDIAGIKVLIAEDDQTSLFMMNAMLRKLNAEVIFALNGEEALEMAQKNPVDLILMDVNMPVMDGITASQKIRQLEVKNSCGDQIPIIAMTAYALSGDREKCIEAGMTDYISKPVNFKLLIEKMRFYWKNAETEKNSTQKNNSENAVSLKKLAFSRAQSEDGEEKLNLESYEDIQSKLMQASGLDKDTCEYVLRTYLEQSIEILKSIESADEERQTEKIGILLHKLKGSSGNVRADEIMKLALNAELAYKAADFNVLKEQLKMILESIQGLLDYVEKSS